MEKYGEIDTITKFERYMINDTLKDDELFRRCLRDDYYAGQIHQPRRTVPLMICHGCSYKCVSYILRPGTRVCLARNMTNTSL